LENEEKFITVKFVTFFSSLHRQTTKIQVSQSLWEIFAVGISSSLLAEDFLIEQKVYDRQSHHYFIPKTIFPQLTFVST